MSLGLSTEQPTRGMFRNLFHLRSRNLPGPPFVSLGLSTETGRVVELWPNSEVYVRNTSYVLSLSFYLRNFFRVIELWPNPEVDVHNASYVLSSSF